MSPDARRWVAGLVECVALVVDHLGQGLALLAETIDPDAVVRDGDTPPTSTTVVDGEHTHHLPGDGTGHRLSEDCPCVPRITGFAATGSGDRWTYTHNDLED